MLQTNFAVATQGSESSLEKNVVCNSQEYLQVSA